MTRFNGAAKWIGLVLSLLVAFGGIFAYVQATYVPRSEYIRDQEERDQMLREIRDDVKKLLGNQVHHPATCRPILREPYIGLGKLQEAPKASF